MQAETKTCQNCKASFEIDAQDFAFYEKIKVPPPTWCPLCRLQRRMVWRNDWHLFKKADALSGEVIFSYFPEEAPVKIYERDYYWSDAWDAGEYGREIDWDRSFFEQFRELLRDVPLPAHSIREVVNSEYCTNATRIKNCYFTRAVTDSEDCAYVIWDYASKRCLDSHMTDHCELGYGNVNCTRSYGTKFSVNCEDCQNVSFSKDCVSCSDCLGCIGLRSKSNHIFNQPYGKEEYAKELEKLNLGSRVNLEEFRKKAHKFWLFFPVKFMQGLQNTNVSGDYIYNSKNASRCWRVKEVENSKFCMNILSGPVKDCYDYSNWGAGSELVYEGLVCGSQNYNLKFCWNTWPGNKNLEYCIFCSGSSDLFGCVGLKKKQYCVLNRQYSEEEYKVLLPKLVEHMKRVSYCDNRGREYSYGDFFPMDFSPLPYNVTAAHEFSPKTEEEVLNEGLTWKRMERRLYPDALSSDDLPDHIKEADESVVEKIILCTHAQNCGHECVGGFRIIPQELEFLRRMKIPLPRLCPNCRHGERLILRNPPRFFKRSCQCAGFDSQNKIYRNTSAHFHGSNPCPNEFETSYAPDRPEIVYCEQCYNSEVV